MCLGEEQTQVLSLPVPQTEARVCDWQWGRLVDGHRIKRVFPSKVESISCIQEKSVYGDPWISWRFRNNIESLFLFVSPWWLCWCSDDGWFKPQFWVHRWTLAVVGCNGFLSDFSLAANFTLVANDTGVSPREFQSEVGGKIMKNRNLLCLCLHFCTGKRVASCHAVIPHVQNCWDVSVW